MSTSYHHMVIKNDKTLWGLGANNYNQLGLPSGSTINAKNGSWLQSQITNVRQVSCGGGHSLILCEDGSVWSSGYNGNGQLGTQANYGSGSATYPSKVFTDAKQVSCMSNTSFVLKHDGTVWACGSGSTGQYGNNTSQSSNATWTKVADNVRFICVGDYNAFIIKDDKTLWACGQNSYGQLGTNINVGSNLSYWVKVLDNVKQVSAGTYTTFALLEDGSVWSCGYNSYGQLGNGSKSTNINYTWAKVFDNAIQVDCNGSSSYVLRNDGVLFACGLNNNYQLGISTTGGTTNGVLTLTQCQTNVSKFDTCGSSCFVLKPDGNYLGVGYNSYGEVGSTNMGTTSPITSWITLLSGGKNVTNYPTPMPKYIFKQNDDIIIYTTGWNKIGTGEITDGIINQYGVTNVAWLTESILNQTPNLDLFVLTDTPNKMCAYYQNNIECMYIIQVGDHYYSNISGVLKEIDGSKLYENGMRKSDIESLGLNDYKNLIHDGNLSIHSFLKCNDKITSPILSDIQITYAPVYSTGSYFVTTGVNQFNTVSWKTINRISITETKPDLTDIRYAFSNDSRVNWKVFRNNEWVVIDNLNDGMTKLEIENLNSSNLSELITDVLDIGICLISSTSTFCPSVDQITIDYVQISNLDTTVSVSIPVPDKGFKNVLTDEINIGYTLKAAEGIAFDDISTDYDFYTTADRIKLRPLNLGTMIGGRPQNVYAFEVINCYETLNLNMEILCFTSDGVFAEPKVTYALLYDSDVELGRTKVELSIDDDFNPIYPITFPLAAGEKKKIYLRITPTIYGTVGAKQVQIKAIGRAIE